MIDPKPPYYAQHGEDRKIYKMFKQIGTTNCHAVEFGADDGLRKSNTAFFRLTCKWPTTLLDADPRADIVHHALITRENVNDVFAAHRIPIAPDLLSIDIDGNDLWVWEALRWQPRIVVIEYNPKWQVRKSRVVPYDPSFQWDKTDYYGASVSALARLASRKGYALAGSTRSNLIFARAGLLPVKSLGSVRRAMHRKRPDPHERLWLVYR